MTKQTSLATLLLVCVALLGCSETPIASPSTLVATNSVVPTPTLSDADMAAKRFRQDFGLRADDSWILAVGADPSADRTTFGVPLTQPEVQDLNGRVQTVDAMRDVVVAYTATQPDWAGTWVDQTRGGILIVQFTGLLDLHREALLAHIRPFSPIEIRLARWSVAELQGFANQVTAEQGWFDSLPAVVIGYGPDVMLDRLKIDLSSADPEVAQKIEAHFGWTDGVVAVSSDGTGALLLPTGRLVIHVLAHDGHPLAGLGCVAIPDISGAYDPRPVPLPRTNALGVCDLVLPASGYSLRLEIGEGPPRLVAQGRATVVAGATTEVTVRAP